jgi:hypothetical protein
MAEASGMAGKYPVSTGGPEDIQTAWKILAGGAPVAAAALVDIAENGKSEIARVTASTAILDRVGLATPKERPSVTFNVIPKEAQEYGITQQLSPAEVIRARLKELGAGGPMAAGGQQYGPPVWTEDTETVDAELVPMPEDADPEDDGDWLPNSNPWS